MTVRIGINPITWTNDDMPALGGDTPLEVCLSEARQAGHAGIEMGGKFPTRVAELKPILDRHGLKLISGWYSAKLLERDAKAEIDAIAQHLDLMSGMGCSVMVFAEGSGATHGDRTQPAGKRRLIGDSEWVEYGKRLDVLAGHMMQRGVRLAFHHHMGTAVQTGPEIDRLMRSTSDAVGLLLDTGHATFAGIDSLSLVRRYSKRIIHVHCKDIRRPALEASLKAHRSFLDAIIDGVFTVPGDGGVDFPPILEALRAHGYSGWLVVEAEQDPAKAHPLTYAAMGYRNLSRMAAEAGFALS
jgi:inosose dehydratase